MIVVAILGLAALTSGKVYDRCELARELKYVHKAPSHQLATWVCIAEHESQYNTSVVGHLCEDGSGDHGIFQISDLYWCSPPGRGYACGITCAELEDDDISDDFLCAQKIYKEHKQLSGDGFNAWAVYKPLCKGSKADRYIKDCFDKPKSPATGFAHGFFDTVAGRTVKPNFLSYTLPSYVHGGELTFPSPKPSAGLLTPTENFNIFTPTSPTTFSTTVRTTTPFKTQSSVFFQPVGLGPTPGRTFLDFGKTSTPSGFQSTTFKDINEPVRKPIFIINGVRWY